MRTSSPVSMIFDDFLEISGQRLSITALAFREGDPAFRTAAQGLDIEERIKAFASAYYILTRRLQPSVETVTGLHEGVVRIFKPSRLSDVLTGEISPEWEVPVYIAVWVTDSLPDRSNKAPKHTESSHIGLLEPINVPQPSISQYMAERRPIIEMEAQRRVEEAKALDAARIAQERNLKAEKLEAERKALAQREEIFQQRIAQGACKWCGKKKSFASRLTSGPNHSDCKTFTQ